MLNLIDIQIQYNTKDDHARVRMKCIVIYGSELDFWYWYR